jgi:hypothetical protein
MENGGATDQANGPVPRVITPGAVTVATRLTRFSWPSTTLCKVGRRSGQAITSAGVPQRLKKGLGFERKLTKVTKGSVGFESEFVVWPGGASGWVFGDAILIGLWPVEGAEIRCQKGWDCIDPPF